MLFSPSVDGSVGRSSLGARQTLVGSGCADQGFQVNNILQIFTEQSMFFFGFWNRYYNPRATLFDLHTGDENTDNCIPHGKFVSSVRKRRAEYDSPFQRLFQNLSTM